jgi:hypothetical protein
MENFRLAIVAGVSGLWSLHFRRLTRKIPPSGWHLARSCHDRGAVCHAGATSWGTHSGRAGRWVAKTERCSEEPWSGLGSRVDPEPTPAPWRSALTFSSTDQPKTDPSRERTRDPTQTAESLALARTRTHGDPAGKYRNAMLGPVSVATREDAEARIAGDPYRTVLT